MPIVRVQVRYLDNLLHTVSDVREISSMLYRRGIKPIKALGVCYRHSNERFFYVDLDLDEVRCIGFCVFNDEEFDVKVVDDRVNYMDGSVHSLCETYCGTNQMDNYDAEMRSFYGESNSIKCICRDEYSNTVSYADL